MDMIVGEKGRLVIQGPMDNLMVSIATPAEGEEIIQYSDEAGTPLPLIVCYAAKLLAHATVACSGLVESSEHYMGREEKIRLSKMITGFAHGIIEQENMFTD